MNLVPTLASDTTGSLLSVRRSGRQSSFEVVCAGRGNGEHYDGDAEDGDNAEEGAVGQQVRLVGRQEGHGADDTPQHGGPGPRRHAPVATAAISTAVPGGRFPASTADRAGGPESKDSP